MTLHSIPSNGSGWAYLPAVGDIVYLPISFYPIYAVSCLRAGAEKGGCCLDQPTTGHEPHLLYRVRRYLPTQVGRQGPAKVQQQNRVTEGMHARLFARHTTEGKEVGSMQ